jgi:hypothetical protein
MSEIKAERCAFPFQLSVPPEKELGKQSVTVAAIAQSLIPDPAMTSEINSNTLDIPQASYFFTQLLSELFSPFFESSFLVLFLRLFCFGGSFIPSIGLF